MSIRTYNCEQRSTEWEDLRRGMVTASVVGRLISITVPDSTAVECPLCGSEAGVPCVSVARKAPTHIKTCHEQRAIQAATLPPVYKVANNDVSKAFTALLVAERINGWSEPVYVSKDMERGAWDEPFARTVYADNYGPVTEVGFIVRDDWGFSIGYSPDGLVGDDGLVEIKSRRARIQLTSILADEIPAENMAQIQAGLLVTGRKWCDYVSFCGGMPLWPKRIYPDPEWQHAIVEAVRTFEANAAEMIAAYTERVAGLPATERTNYEFDVEL